jgi:TonB family protein
MTTVALLIVKASLVLAVAFAATSVLRRQSAALRHWILAVGLLCAAVMPALQWLTPAWTLPDFWPHSYAVSVPAATPATSAATVADVNRASMSAEPPTSSTSWTTWLVAAWLSGAAGAMVVLFAGLWRMQRVVKRTVPLTEPRVTELAHRLSFRLRARPVTLVEGSDPALLVTCGWWQPRIVLPPGCREWPDDKLSSVLSHELAHIRRCDWLVQLGAEAVRCIYWFNPLFWLAARRLRAESERACDDAVLYEGIDAASYASHLLDIARAASHSRALPLALGMAHSTSLEGRVRAMFGERMDRRPMTSRAAFVTTLLMVAVAVPIASSTLEGGEQRMPERLPAFPIVAPQVLVSAPAALTPSIATRARLPRRPSARRIESAGSAMPATAAVADQATAVVQREIPAAGSASFAGIVRGSAGAPMAGAAVVMTDVATGAVRAAKTAADGRFAFFALPAAGYSVTVSSPGWATVRRDLALEDGQQEAREFAMRMGVLSEVVTVPSAGDRGGSSAPGPGDTTRAQLSNVSPPAPTRVCDANGRNCLIAPVKLVHVRPVYPPEALARGAQGVVILEATIGQSGVVSDARVLRGIDPALNAAALDAVKQWEFTPTLLDGMPTAIIMTVTFNYTIQ